MAMYFPKMYLLPPSEPETQEQIQERVDKMDAKTFNTCLVTRMFDVVSDMFQPYYEPPCGLPTPNGMMMLALARRLARENNVDVKYSEILYAERSNTKVVEAEEGMLLDQD